MTASHLSYKNNHKQYNYRSESVRIDEETLVSVASQLPNTGDLFAMIARQAQENAIAQELLSSFKAEGIQAQQQS